MSEPVQFAADRNLASVDSNSDSGLSTVLRNDFQFTEEGK
jgi:hypothetical protein